MRLHPEPFKRVLSGEKKIECRLNDEKRRELVAGDVILFTNRETGETVEKEVTALYVFPTFAAMFEQFPEERGDGNMYQYYSPEDEETFGTLAIELK